MDFDDPELVAEFAIESLEGLANVEQQMLSLEACGETLDRELVNAVFRTMHSIKGTAGFLGLGKISDLAHALEEVLNDLRNGALPVTSDLVSTVLAGADFIQGMIENIADSEEAEISPHVAALASLRSGEEAPAEATSAAAEQPAPPQAEEPAPTPEPEEQAPSEANEPPPAAAPPVELSGAAQEFLGECNSNLDKMETLLNQLDLASPDKGALRTLFRTMHTIKGGAAFLAMSQLERLAQPAEELLAQLRDGARTPDQPLLELLRDVVDHCRLGLRVVEGAGHDRDFDPSRLTERLHAALKDGVESPASAEASAETVAGSPPPPEPKSVPVAPPLPKEGGPKNGEGTPSLADSTIRVDVQLLDKLMTRVGELVLAREPDSAVHQRAPGRELRSRGSAIELDHDRAARGRDENADAADRQCVGEVPPRCARPGQAAWQAGSHRNDREGHRTRQDHHRSHQGPAHAPRP